MSSAASPDGESPSNSSGLQNLQLTTNWDEVICPICLDFPHNGVLLECSSYKKGCRTFVCDTDYAHSNCLERFKAAYGIPSSMKVASSANGVLGETIHETSEPTCPLCRGCVIGWMAVDEARMHLDSKRRCCEEKSCTYVGNYMELQNHAKLQHPHARPAEIDPVRKLDWENFQQSSEIIDVLSTMHSEMPRGVVLGDYIIEYGDDETGDEYEDFPGDEGNWWTSCILYNVFDNFRASRNRRRARRAEIRREHHRSSPDGFNTDEGSASSVDIAEYRYDDTDDELIGVGASASSAATNSATTRGNSSYHSFQRRRLASMASRHAR